METLAPSDMAAVSLINLIGKSTGCLADYITSAHSSPPPYFILSMLSLLEDSRFFSKSPSVLSQLTLLEVYMQHNLLHYDPTALFFPRLRSILCEFVSGCLSFCTLFTRSLSTLPVREVITCHDRTCLESTLYATATLKTSKCATILFKT